MVSAIVVVVIAAVIFAVKQNPQSQKPESRSDGAITPVSQSAPQPTTQQPAQPTYYSTKLTRPVELKDSVGRVVAKLQQGQSVQYVGRGTYFVRIRYNGADYDIRISSTDLK